VRVGVLPVDLHVRAVPQHALDHRGDLGGLAGFELAVDAQRLLLDVPVDHHTGAAVPLVPLGHEVRGPGAEVLGVARAPTNRRRPLIALAIGIVCALAMGRIAQYLVVSVGIESKLTERIYGLSAGIAVGMTVTSIGLVYGLAGEPTTATKPREIVRSDFVYGLMGGLAVGLAVGLTGAAFGFIDGPLGSLEYRLALGPAPGLAAGLAFTGAGAGCRYLDLPPVLAGESPVASGSLSRLGMRRRIDTPS
jgi:hypothetical protein